MYNEGSFYHGECANCYCFHVDCEGAEYSHDSEFYSCFQDFPEFDMSEFEHIDEEEIDFVEFEEYMFKLIDELDDNEPFDTYDDEF